VSRFGQESKKTTLVVDSWMSLMYMDNANARWRIVAQSGDVEHVHCFNLARLAVYVMNFVVISSLWLARRWEFDPPFY
jgi:hypothetical protein